MQASITLSIAPNTKSIQEALALLATMNTALGGTAAEAPVTKKAGKKAKPAEEDAEEFSLDESDDAEAEEMTEEGEDDAPAEEDEEPETSIDDVREAMKKYAAKNGREKAVKLLAKFKVKSINDLKSKDYDAVIKATKSK